MVPAPQGDHIGAQHPQCQKIDPLGARIPGRCFRRHHVVRGEPVGERVSQHFRAGFLQSGNLR